MSRIAKLCSWCSAPIPDQLRFSPEEISTIHASEAAAKKQLASMERARTDQERKKDLQDLAGEIVGSGIVAAVSEITP